MIDWSDALQERNARHMELVKDADCIHDACQKEWVEDAD